MSCIAPSNKGGLRGGFRLQEAQPLETHLENQHPSKKRFANHDSPTASTPKSVPSNKSPVKDSIKLSLSQQFGVSGADSEDASAWLEEEITTNVQRILSDEIDFVPAVNSHNTLLLNIQKNCTDVSTLLVKTVHQFQCGRKKAGMLAGGDVHHPYDAQTKSPARDGLLKTQLTSSPPTSTVSSSPKKLSADDCLPEPTKNFFDEKNVQLEWGNGSGCGAGLLNVGNTCFLNATLQCLAYTPALINYLALDDHKASCRYAGYCITCELQKLLPAMVRSRNQNLRPHGIYGNIKAFAKTLSIGRQEDAHEFLRFVVEAMRKTALTATGEDMKRLDLFTQETTFASRIFGGFYRSRVLCQNCKVPSNSYDPFMDIPLDIARASRLDEALRAFIRVENLNSPNNLYKCERCKKSCPATKQVTIHKPPAILTFQLKRFLFNSFSSFSKIDKPVEFPETLNLKEFMSVGETSEPVMYQLYAVLVHSGSSCHSGHYFSFVRAANNSWFRMDDTSVSPAGRMAVLNQRAYLLFYTRTKSDRIVPVNNLQPRLLPIGPRLAPLQNNRQNGNAKEMFFPNSTPLTGSSKSSTAESPQSTVTRLPTPTTGGPVRPAGLTNHPICKSSISLVSSNTGGASKVSMQFVPRQLGFNKNVLNGVKPNGTQKPPLTPVKMVSPVVSTALVPYGDDDDEDELEPTVTHPEPTSRGSSTSSSDSAKENKDRSVATSPKKGVAAALDEVTQSAGPIKVAQDAAEATNITNITTPPEPFPVPLLSPADTPPLLSKKERKKLKRMLLAQQNSSAGLPVTVVLPTSDVVAAPGIEEKKKKKRKKNKKRHDKSNNGSPTRGPVWVEKESAVAVTGVNGGTPRKPQRDSELEPTSKQSSTPQGSSSPRRPEILSWSGGKSLLDQDTDSDALERRKRQFEEMANYDNDFDAGRSKKFKSKSFAHPERYRYGNGDDGGNAFQRHQNYRTDCDLRSKNAIMPRSSHSDNY